MIAVLGFLALSAASAVGQTLPRLATSGIGAGQFAFAPDPYSQPPFESEILLVRSLSGELRAWFFPVRQGLRRLPADAHWSAGPPCARLSVDFTAGVIGCSDASLTPLQAKRYRWGLDGKRRSEFVPDLLPIPGAEVGGFFVIHQPAAT